MEESRDDYPEIEVEVCAWRHLVKDAVEFVARSDICSNSRMEIAGHRPKLIAMGEGKELVLL
jgi:hypothetical protein